jgi:hypothetical protein
VGGCAFGEKGEGYQVRGVVVEGGGDAEVGGFALDVKLEID